MKKFIIVVAVLMSLAILVSCSSTAAPDQFAQSGNGSYGYDKSTGEVAVSAAPVEAPNYGRQEGAPMPSPEPAVDGEGITDANVIGGIQGANPGDSILQPNVNRKIVYNGNIVANTKEFDKDCDTILSTLLEFGGYVESSYINGTKPESREDKGRQAQMTLRVPNKKFDMFITMLKGVGQNVSSNVSGQDISLSYYDREARLAVLRVQQAKLLELFDKAVDSEAQINFYNQYTTVSDEIQRLETDLRTYDSLIDFSTINITLNEVLEITAVTPAEEDLGTRISNGFYSSLNGLADVGEWLLVFFASAWPVLIILAIIIFLIVFFTKRSNRKREANKLPPFPPYMQGGQSDEKQD